MPTVRYKKFTQAEIDRREQFVPIARKIMAVYFGIFWKHRRGVPGKRDPSSNMSYEQACQEAPKFVALRTEELLNMLQALDNAGFDILKKGAYILKQRVPTLRTVKVFRPAPPNPIKRIPLSTARPQHQIRRVVNQGRRVLRGNAQSVGTAIGQASGLSADDLRGGDPGGATSSGEEERLESGVELHDELLPEDTGQPPADDDIGGSDSSHDSGEMD